MAVAVIKSAIVESQKNPQFDWSFFDSNLFHFYAGLAYGGNENYRSGKDIIDDIMKGDMERDLRRDNGGHKSKYS